MERRVRDIVKVNGSAKFGEATVSYLRNHLSNKTGIWFDYANTMRFITSNTEKMIIKSDGNIGIGTTTPTDLLDVKGKLIAGSNNIKLVILMAIMIFLKLEKLPQVMGQSMTNLATLLILMEFTLL